MSVRREEASTSLPFCQVAGCGRGRGRDRGVWRRDGLPKWQGAGDTRLSWERLAWMLARLVAVQARQCRRVAADGKGSEGGSGTRSFPSGGGRHTVRGHDARGNTRAGNGRLAGNAPGEGIRIAAHRWVAQMVQQVHPDGPRPEPDAVLRRPGGYDASPTPGCAQAYQLEPILALQADKRVALPSARADQPAVRRMEVRGGRELDQPTASHADAWPTLKADSRPHAKTAMACFERPDRS